MLSFLLKGAEKQRWYKDSFGNIRKWLIPIRGRKSGEYTHVPHYRGDSGKLMVCVKPMNNGPWQDFAQLLNFLVYYDTLGVEHFVLYNAGSATPHVLHILQVAESLGISISVLPWNLRETHGHSMYQSLLVEICNYEAMLSGYENVLIADYDELIVPRESKDLLGLIQDLDQAYPNASNYRFANHFFRLVESDSANATSRMVSLRKVKHEKPTKDYQRSKMIVKPKRVGDVHIHLASPVNQSYMEIRVPTDVAKMHHYRFRCEIQCSEARDKNVSVDYTIPNRFQSQLLSNRLYQKLKTHIEVER
jgi:hypothetical protein